MMDREWNAVLRRYGQTVTIYSGKDCAGRTVRAFLQPVTETGKEQRVPSPLGHRREDRVLYFGPGDVPLVADVGWVECRGQVYDIQSAQVQGGEKPHHWWAVLRPRDEVRA